jgi:hypothetical protein
MSSRRSLFSANANNATSASFSDKAALATLATLATNANYATSASYALTASYAMNGGGGGSTDTGSLLTTASFSNPNLTFTKGNNSTFPVNLITLIPTNASTASYIDGGTF